MMNWFYMFFWSVTLRRNQARKRCCDGAQPSREGQKSPRQIKSLKLMSVILCTAENSTIDCEDFENWFVFWEAADTGVSKASKSANPNSKDRNRLAVNVLRLYFSAPPSGDIHIACQSDRKKSSPQSYSSIVEFSTAKSIHHYYKLTLVNGY